MIDATTGLIYVGNGQYYDPETGRFLTRGVNPNSPNPYVPWNPIGAVFGPLALASIYYSRKKGKKSLWSTLLFISLFLAGCSCPQWWYDLTNTTPPDTSNSTQSAEGSGTDTGNNAGNPGAANENPTATTCPPGGCNTAEPSPAPTTIPTHTLTPYPYTYTILNMDELSSDIIGPTGVSAQQLYQFYLDYYVKNTDGWWWDAFAREDKDFSIWDYISAVTYFEANRQTRFSTILAEAGVRFYHGRCDGNCDTNPEAILNWWADFSESAARQQKNNIVEPLTIGNIFEMAIVGDSFSLKNPNAINWATGWDYSRPYNWGNLYAIKNPATISIYKSNSHALFIKYGTDAEWDNNQTFVVPSGCLWKKGEEFDDEGWKKHSCPAVTQIN